MKFFLVLCLLAAISCAEVIDIIKCLAANPSIQEFVMEIINIIQSKDYIKLVNLFMKYFSPIYDAVMKCI